MIGQESVWCIVYIQGPYFFFKDYNKSNLSLSVSTFFSLLLNDWSRERLMYCLYTGSLFFFKDYNKSNLSLSVSTFFFFVTEWLVKRAFDVLSIYRVLIFFSKTTIKVICHCQFQHFFSLLLNDWSRERLMYCLYTGSLFFFQRLQ